MLSSDICVHACVHVYCKCMSYDIRSLKPTVLDVDDGEEIINKSFLRKVDVSLKCYYLCNSQGKYGFCSCNKAKVYFGSILETLIHGQLSLLALWYTVIMVEVCGRGATCLMEPGMKERRDWNSNIPFREPPWHSFCEIPLL